VIFKIYFTPKRMKNLIAATVDYRYGPGQERDKVESLLRELASLALWLRESICNHKWGFCVSQRD
jgi:hypothetical protein